MHAAFAADCPFMACKKITTPWPIFTFLGIQLKYLYSINPFIDKVTPWPLMSDCSCCIDLTYIYFLQNVEIPVGQGYLYGQG